MVAAALCACPGAAGATAAPSLALDPLSPTLSAIGAQAGEVLNPAVPPAPGPLPNPVRSVTLSALGLVAGDVPTALSFGLDAIPSGVLFFSVDRASDGIGGLFPPDVDSERSTGAAGDVYRSFFPPNHTLVLDGDGADLNPPPDGLGLDEDGSPIDNLIGFDMCGAAAVDPDADGVLDAPIYFTLAAGSPTLTTLGAMPHDVLRSRVGVTGSATLWTSGSALGLVAGDAIDGLATDATTLYFSLAPGSPTLLGPDGTPDFPNDPNPDDMTPADVMSQAFLAVYPASALNLNDDDDLVGLSVGFDQLFADREPQPSPLGFASHGITSLIEALEHPLTVLGGDSDPRIGHADLHCILHTPSRHHDISAGGRELEGIAQQIAQDLFDPRAVPVDRWQVFCAFHSQADGTRLRLRVECGH